MRALGILLLACAIAACGNNSTTTDGGSPPVDGGRTGSDSGTPDSGTTDSGLADAGPASPVQGTYPGATPVLVGYADGGQILIAPDNQHLAIMQNVSNFSPFTGTLSLLAVTNPPSQLIPVDAGIDSVWLYFTPDSHLLYRDNATSTTADLELIAPDGTGQRTIATGTHTFVPAGEFATEPLQLRASTVFFDQGTQALSCALPNGNPAALDPGSSSELTEADPTGAWAVIAEPAGTTSDQQTFFMVSVASGAKTQLLAAGQGFGDPRWSDNGRFFFFASNYTAPLGPGVPMLVTPGSAPVQLAANYDRFAGFSPDGSRIAYATSGTTGEALIVHPIAGGSDVSVASPVPLGYQAASLFFSPDWSHVFVAVQQSGGTQVTLYAAPVQNGASLTQLSTALQYAYFGCAPSLDGKYCAAEMNDGSLAVIPSDGSPLVTVAAKSGDLAWYEPVAPGRLLVFNTTTAVGTTPIVGSQILSAEDGTSPINLPGSSTQYSGTWFGNLATWQTNPQWSGTTLLSYDLGAATDDGTVTGTLAAQINWYNWNPGGSRIFVVATDAAGGGIWYVDVPAH